MMKKTFFRESVGIFRRICKQSQLGLIAIIAVMGFSLITCGGGSSGGTGNPGQPPGRVRRGPLDFAGFQHRDRAYFSGRRPQLLQP